DQRCQFSLENALPERLAVNHWMKDLREHHRIGIDSGDDLQLSQRFRPISKNAMKLKQEYPKLRIFRMCADFVLKFEQCFVRLPRSEVFFGGHPFRARPWN